MSGAPSPRDVDYMRECLRQAAAAEAAGEVPVGAVLVNGDRVVARGHNQPIGTHDPSAHAEIVTLRAAGQVLGNYRLTESELYVSVEPCLMCVGAIIQARVRRVVYGCADPKGGALGGLFDATAVRGLNHRFAVSGGVLAEESQAVLRRFFQTRRAAPPSS